jgi:hypothetical protein
MASIGLVVRHFVIIWRVPSTGYVLKDCGPTTDYTETFRIISILGGNRATGGYGGAPPTGEPSVAKRSVLAAVSC